jgi:GGDEF domain-containing protein
VFASIDDPRLTEREREIYRRWDFGSELSIPLFSDDRLVGLIDIFDQRARDYAEHLDLGGPERGLTVSEALATLPHDADLMEELVDKADWALYLAKRQGRDRVMPFGPSAHEQSIEAPAAT